MKHSRWLLFLIFVIGFAGCSANLNPTPYLFLSKSTLDFGNVVVSSVKTLDLEFQNHDMETLTIRNFQFIDYSNIANGDEFTIDEVVDEQNQPVTDIANIKIKKYSKITVRIKFAPVVLAKIDAKLRFTHNDGKLISPLTVDLTGRGVESCISFSPESLNFDSVVKYLSETRIIEIRNASLDDIEITSLEIAPLMEEFSVVKVIISENQSFDEFSAPITLKSNEFIVVEIEFNPKEAKNYNASLQIEYEVLGFVHQSEIELAGLGALNEPPEILNVDTDPIRVGEEATIKVTVRDSNGIDDIDNITVAIDTTPALFVPMSEFTGDYNTGYVTSGTVKIPSNIADTGYKTVSVKVLDRSNSFSIAYTFQMIYVGNLIEVGSGKPFTTIKPAVASAVDGDCVLIYDGVYDSANDTIEENRDISLDGKNIIITSKNSADKTEINVDGGAGNFHRAFNCTNGETLNTIIDGLTIKGGFMRHEYGGGAVVCVDSAVTLLNCVFKENVGTCDSNGYAYGGVVSAIDSELIVRKTHFISNSSFV